MLGISLLTSECSCALGGFTVWSRSMEPPWSAWSQTLPFPTCNSWFTFLNYISLSVAVASLKQSCLSTEGFLTLLLCFICPQVRFSLVWMPWATCREQNPTSRSRAQPLRSNTSALPYSSSARGRSQNVNQNGTLEQETAEIFPTAVYMMWVCPLLPHLN